MLGQFSDRRYLLFFSFSFFFLLLPKSFLFPAYYQICLRKMTISDSFTVGSSWNLSTRFTSQLWTFSPLRITKRCRSWEKYCSHRDFFFSRRNLELSQWNYDPEFFNRWIFTKFWYVVLNSIFHIFTIWDLRDNIRGGRKRNRMKIVWMEASIPSHSL